MQTPAETHAAWTIAFNCGDLAALSALYERSAVLIAQPGQCIAGLSDIRETFTALVATGAKLSLSNTRVIESDDIALVNSDWTLTGGKAADGGSIDSQGETTDVLRRHKDGRWLFVIDNPWGVKHMASAG
jgi:uncharacterized protein (TIGR02246 family)